MTADDITEALEIPMEHAANTLSRALDRLGLNGAATPMGALEAHALAIKEAAETIANAIESLAQAVSEHGAQE